MSEPHFAHLDYVSGYMQPPSTEVFRQMRKDHLMPFSSTRI